MEYDNGKSQTRILEQNIHNLVYAQYDGVGEYDIPEMLPTHIDNLADKDLEEDSKYAIYVKRMKMNLI